jgi:membrane fusion protein (multidrug efflux system)
MATNRDNNETGGNGKKTAAHSNRGPHEPNAPPRETKRKKQKFHFSKKTLIVGGIVVAVVLIGALLYWLHSRNFESTDDAYTTAHVHEISARVPGTIEKVEVNDNQVVKTGQPLIRLDPRDFKAMAEQARAQVLQRRAAAEQSKANLDRASKDYDRFSKLGGEQVVSKQEVDNATAALKTTTGALAAAKADLATAEAALTNAELQLSYTTIVAPSDGVVGKKTAERGARVQPGQALLAVVEQNVWVLANFKETQLKKVRVGQHVDVIVDAVPDHMFSAHVDSFQPGTGATFALLPPDNATGNFTKIVQRVPVKIVFDDLGAYRSRVVPGLSCIPKIDLRTGLHQ